MACALEAQLQTCEIPSAKSIATYKVPTRWKSPKALGSGAYAYVAAFTDEDGTEFAVKKVEDVFNHPILALRTLREIRLLTHLQHPNILCIRQLFPESPNFADAYICM